MARHAPLRSSQKEPSAAVDGAHPERPMPKFKGRATPRYGAWKEDPERTVDRITARSHRAPARGVIAEWGGQPRLLRKPGQRNITMFPAGCSAGPRSPDFVTPAVCGAGRGAPFELGHGPLRTRTTVGGAGLPLDVPARGVARHGWRASSPQGCALQRPRGGTSKGSPVPVMTARARSGVSTRWRPPRTVARPRASPPPPRRRGACRAARVRAASPC